MANLYPTINIDWGRYDHYSDPAYSDDADTILKEMRDAFEGWQEEGFDYNPLEHDEIALHQDNLLAAIGELPDPCLGRRCDECEIGGCEYGVQVVS